MVNIPTEALWQQMVWVLLFLLSIYLISVWGESIRKGWDEARNLRVVRAVSTDIRVITGSALAVGGIVFGVANPLNFGAALGALAGWAAPLWSVFATAVMSLANALGITGFSVADVFLISVLVGSFAFALRQWSLIEE